MRRRTSIPRIVKINEVRGMQISVLFNTGENRVLDFIDVFKGFKVKKNDPEYILQKPSELKKVTLSETHALSWNNAGQAVKWKGVETMVPFEIGADILYSLSIPDPKRKQPDVGQILRKARLTAGLSQEELAERCGTSRFYISRIENNQSDIELNTLKRIASGLDKELKIEIK